MFRREFFRSQAEAGDVVALRRVIDVVSRPVNYDDELAYLAQYGWTSASIRENIDRKLNYPSIRDQQLKQFYVTMGEVLLDRPNKAINPSGGSGGL